MQRTIHCMGFVVEWFIGMQWPAFGFGRRWTAWLCLSLCVSLLLTVCFLGHLTCFSCTFLSRPSTSLEVLFPFLHLRFSLFLCVSESPSYHRYITSISLSFFPVSEYPPHPFSTLSRNSRLRGGSVNIYSTEFSLRSLCPFPVFQLVLGRMSNIEPDPLAWFVASVGSMWTMKCCSRAHANCIATFIKNCQWVSKVLKCFTWNVLMIYKE